MFKGEVTITGKSLDALVVDMYYIRGISQTEISKILEISQPTVSRILTKYKEAIKRK